ncbi:PREDICTED: F-box/kelch-repeat protein At1g64840-like [Brassica oleracea var. oleracea]|nr:PREDICTED: F-box/kelch-repeat protein At1g64840-like [Brassica oleracea var. oleracea]
MKRRGCAIYRKRQALGSRLLFTSPETKLTLNIGHQYRMIGCDAKEYRGVAVLPLNKEGEGDFVVLLNCTSVLMVLRSNEMRWRRFQTLSTATCDDLVTFRGRFYALFVNGDVSGFDPHFLELTPLVRLELLNCGWSTSLVPSGDDELFLVEKIIPHNGNALDFARLTLRVCRLDVEAGQWVVVKDIGDCVFIIGDLGTVSCSAKELSDGCGVCVNSILFTYGPGNVTYSYKYEDDLNCWRYSREKRATILSRSPVVALRVERSSADAYSHRASPQVGKSVYFTL